jgi:hypothetical protein
LQKLKFLAHNYDMMPFLNKAQNNNIAGGNESLTIARVRFWRDNFKNERNTFPMWGTMGKSAKGSVRDGTGCRGWQLIIFKF